MTENYRIPPDNPFIDATSFNGKPLDFEKVRTEFFAVGLRNPWRFAFDSKTGELYCNDVGTDLFEEINLILAAAITAGIFTRAPHPSCRRPGGGDEFTQSHRWSNTGAIKAPA
jgi:hypothetical protein